MTNPTEGPWEIGPDETWHRCRNGTINNLKGKGIARYTLGKDGDANARLIVAAGTAAQQAKDLGFDPIAAVEALPTLLDALAFYADPSNHTEDIPDFYSEMDFAAVAYAALDKARAKKDIDNA